MLQFKGLLPLCGNIRIQQREHEMTVMNKTHMKTLRGLMASIEALSPQFEKLRNDVLDITEEMQHFIDGLEEDFESHSEKWQEGEKGEALMFCICELNNALLGMNDIETGIDVDGAVSGVVQTMSESMGIEDDDS